jgi:phospholipid/cholesterol/gamma-HCH transport system permease protein
MKRFIESFGRNLITSAKNAGYGCLLLFEAIYWLKAFFTKFREILRQMYIVGFQSLPVTLIVGVFVGFVLALQTGLSLKAFGMEHLVAQIAGISMTREMGPLMTSIILAGRVGSAMAAEIGSMRVSEEIEALEVMSISPVKYLVMPRIVALTLMCPILTIFANTIGIVGAAIVGKLQIGVPYYTFFNDAAEFIEFKDIYSGLFKALIFGITIATVSCSEGLRTRGGTVGVGESTRRAVVNSLLLILILNYFMTSLISRLFY